MFSSIQPCFAASCFSSEKKTTAFGPNISRVSSLLFSFRSCSICRSASLRQEPGATNLSNCWLSSTSWLQSDYQTSILRVEPSRVESSRLLNTLLFISSLRRRACEANRIPDLSMKMWCRRAKNNGGLPTKSKETDESISDHAKTIPVFLLGPGLLEWRTSRSLAESWGVEVFW